MPTNFKTKVIDLNDLKNHLLNQKVVCATNTNLYLIDHTNTNQNVHLEFAINNGCVLNFYVVVVANKANHNFLFNFIHQSNSQLSMTAKLFAADNSQINVNGQIKVNPKITNVISNQEINGFLFSNQAKIDAFPILAIDSNKVKVNHAVKVSQINNQELFYLQTKGFDDKQATKILLDHELSFLKPLEKNYHKKYIQLIQDWIKRTVD